MLDEPLGDLDRSLKEQLMLELPELLAELQQTAIYVTHDQEEAFAVADRVLVLNRGRLEQLDTPEAMFRRPASPFVARFLGLDNLIPGRAVRHGSGWLVETELGSFPARGRRRRRRSRSSFGRMRPAWIVKTARPWRARSSSAPSAAASSGPSSRLQAASG